ncbi:hypothetical protein Syun_009589 [Stephania yunnanensis]|uniref:Uncharacterized protein n=1 Tax=Stephania yunnanensis TaxID=152371 RepID=A0AAP0KFV1_9MAGN
MEAQLQHSPSLGGATEWSERRDGFMVCMGWHWNDDLALVQTRWAFVNKDENLLTRLQNINLSFHFEVEQQVNGILIINFFGFNGTAGVWRIKALEESGG